MGSTRTTSCIPAWISARATSGAEGSWALPRCTEGPATGSQADPSRLKSAGQAKSQSVLHSLDRDYRLIVIVCSPRRKASRAFLSRSMMVCV
jgi:hypothetical protein